MFVFEARRMPFDNISEATCSPLVSEWNIPSHTLAALSLWQKCMLTAVLPVLHERHAVSSHACVGADKDNNSAAAPDEEEEEMRVALQIVHQLDELETISEDVRRQRDAAQTSHNKQAKSCLTDERLFFDQLLRERMLMRGAVVSEEADENASDDSSEEDEMDTNDMAMCFDVHGNSVGVGPAHLFGGHGYHDHHNNNDS